jgi:hypothetical protein
MYSYFIFQFRRGDPGEIKRAWRCHDLLNPVLSWSIVSFCAFSGVHVGLRISAAAMQFIAMGAIVSTGLVHILARKLTTPVFDHHEVPQRDRREVHALWMFFMMPGIGLGLLPMFLPIK